MLSWIVPTEKQQNALIQQAFLDALASAVNLQARVIIVTDVALMRFDNVTDGRLQLEQGKGGARLSLPLDLELAATGLQLRAVIDRCRQVSTTDFMISAGIRKNSPNGALHPDGLTKKFVTARRAAGIEFADSPPTFHEIRSLAGRLYEREKGKEFAQKLLGHKSEAMAGKYLDSRGKEYVML